MNLAQMACNNKDENTPKVIALGTDVGTLYAELDPESNAIYLGIIPDGQSEKFDVARIKTFKAGERRDVPTENGDAAYLDIYDEKDCGNVAGIYLFPKPINGEAASSLTKIV